MTLLTTYNRGKGYSIAIVLLLLCSLVIAQPMAGSKYTINKNVGATGTNFTSFQSFFNALAVRGVSGPVNCDVVSGSGPYIEQATITSISGVSNTNKVSINGNNEILRFNATVNNQRHTLKFDGADYITIRNLEIEAVGINYAWAVHITNNAENNTLDNCTIKIVNYTGSFGGIGIAIVPSNITALAKGSAAKNLTITSCTIMGTKSAGPGYGIIVNPQANGGIASNITIQHSRIEDFFEAGIYVVNAKGLVIKSNSVLRPKRETGAAITYGIRLVNSNQEDTIISNRIYDCYKAMISNSLFSTFYGIYLENISVGNILVANNAIYNNHNSANWHGIFLSCSNNISIVHNTISAGKTTNSAGDIYGFFHGTSTCSVSQGSEFVNNNISIDRVGNSNRYGVYHLGGAITINHNNVFVSGTNANVGFAGSTAHKTLTDWQTASGNGAPFGANSTAVPPKFTNLATGNLIPQAVGMDNSGSNVGLKQDIVNAPRNTNPDVGAFEFNVDANVSRIITSATSYCEGESDTIGFWVVNKSLQGVNNFSIGFTFGNNPEIFEHIEDTIPTNDSLLVKLSTPTLFSDTGSMQLYARIKGKAQVGPKIININPLPKGITVLKGNTYNGFFNGGDAIDPDIILATDSSTYELTPPLGYSNNNYGSLWQIESIDFSVLNSTKNIGSSDTSTTPALSSQNTKYLFRPAASLQGETVKIDFTIKNIITGCVSKKVARYIKIIEKPNAVFSTANVCEGLIANFNNLSTGQGVLRYKWDFGDGDSSVATNPQKIYNKPGNYNVKLYAITQEGFIDSSSTIITIYNAPDAGFIFKNQCEGVKIDFFDTSTVFNGQPQYFWDFGDSKGLATTKTPSYLYALNGVYSVALTVKDSIGCETQVTKQVTFAKKPTANFSLPVLNCNQKEVAFTNNTISNEPLGFTWFFGDGDSTISRHTDHTYANEGVYTVLLVARNSFNCKDTIKKTLTLLGSPDPDFIVSTTCANEVVVFNNTTKEPLNTEVNYLWTVNNTSQSSDVSPIFTFTSIGSVEVKLRAVAKNGCIAEITRFINFTEKPIADFVIPQNVCSGIEYTAVNNTVISTGSLSFNWSLGNKTTTIKSPTDTFNVKGKYPIQLIASSSLGCSDTVIKTLNVIAIPNSNFIAESRKTGDGFMVFTPVEVNGDGNYNWKYGPLGGSNTKQRNEVQFSISGVYKITLQIINQGCASITSKDININLTSVKNIIDDKLVNVYPNPSSGAVKIQLENNQEIRGLKVFDSNGKLLVNKDFFGANAAIEVNENLVLENGVYLLKIITENRDYSKRIVIVN